MADQISPSQFSESDGVEDWRVLIAGACSFFPIDSFPQGAEFISRISELAEAANHHPDIDLRYGGVTIRIMTHSVGGLTEKDVSLARQVSELAGEMGLKAEPRRVKLPQSVIGAGD